MRGKIGIISASGWLFSKKSITTHGNMNAKSVTNKQPKFCNIPEE